MLFMARIIVENQLDDTNYFSPESCLTIRIGQISNSYEFEIIVENQLDDTNWFSPE